MIHGALQRSLTWAEDTALQRCNRSAAPGVGVKAGPDHCRTGHLTTSHQHPSEKPVWHDATLPTAGRLSQLANANQSKFQFTLSQHTNPTLFFRETNDIFLVHGNLLVTQSFHDYAVTTQPVPLGLKTH